MQQCFIIGLDCVFLQKKINGSKYRTSQKAQAQNY